MSAITDRLKSKKGITAIIAAILTAIWIGTGFEAPSVVVDTVTSVAIEKLGNGQ